MPKFTPHPEQKEAIDYVLEHKSVLIKAGVGAGKTLVGVEAVLASQARVVVVIGPINTFTGWRKTFARQSGGTAELRWIINTRVAGKRAYDDLLAGTAGFYFIGRELFRTKPWSKIKADFAIFDEVHSISNRKSKSFKVVTKLKAPYKLGLSATPAGDHLSGLWSVSRWLWPSKTPRGYWNWITEFFHTERDKFADAELADGTVIEGKKVTVERVPGATWASLPAAHTMPSVYRAEPTIHEVEVDISREQRKHYKELEEESITWLKDNPLAIDLPATLHIRLRQVCLAVPSVTQGWKRKQDKETKEWYDDWGDIVYFDEDAKSSKIDALLEILSDLHVETPTPVLVFTDSRLFATITTKRLQAAGYRARQFVGGMSIEERFWKLENFGKEFDVMVCVISAISTGTDGLQDVCHTEVWLNYGYWQIENEQAEGRLSRQGQIKTVQRFVIKARDTVETRQLEGLEDKKEQLLIGYGQ